MVMGTHGEKKSQLENRGAIRSPFLVKCPDILPGRQAQFHSLLTELTVTLVLRLILDLNGWVKVCSGMTAPLRSSQTQIAGAAATLRIRLFFHRVRSP